MKTPAESYRLRAYLQMQALSDEFEAVQDPLGERIMDAADALWLALDPDELEFLKPRAKEEALGLRASWSMASPNVPLTMYAVYEHPKDFPDSYVVRRWVILNGTVLVDLYATAISAQLEEARKKIPGGLYPFPRGEDDDPAVLEVWL